MKHIIIVYNCITSIDIHYTYIDTLIIHRYKVNKTLYFHYAWYLDFTKYITFYCNDVCFLNIMADSLPKWDICISLQLVTHVSSTFNLDYLYITKKTFLYIFSINHAIHYDICTTIPRKSLKLYHFAFLFIFKGGG